MADDHHSRVDGAGGHQGVAEDHHSGAGRTGDHHGGAEEHQGRSSRTGTKSTEKLGLASRAVSKWPPRS